MTSIIIFQTRQSATAAKPTGEKSAFESFKDFFAKQHRFGRSPFAGMPTSWM